MPNQDTKDFISGIELFSNNNELLEKASTRARNTVLEKFTLKQMPDVYTDLYQEVFEKKSLKSKTE